MNQDLQSLIAHLSQAIKALQDIQADSSTPLEAALAVMVPMRRLDKCRDALREKAFVVKANDAGFKAAVAQLEAVTAATAKQLGEHESNMKFISAVADAADAVIKLATAIGATVAGI